MRGVKVFSSAAVRDAAYGGAGEPTLEEGETCYVTAVDELQVYDGAAWVAYRKAGAGQVLQVVSTTKTDTFTSSNIAVGATSDITGLTATITPSSTSSKILVMANVNGQMLSATVARAILQINVYRDSTLIGAGATAGSRTLISSSQGALNAVEGVLAVPFVHLDSPNTTSAITYKVAGVNATTNNSVANFYINRSLTDTDSAHFPRAASSITVMEISA
jgi:hypothetical protein